MRYLVAFLVLSLSVSCSRSKNVTLAKDLDAKTLSERMCEQINRGPLIIPLRKVVFEWERLFGQRGDIRLDPYMLQRYQKLSAMGILTVSTTPFSFYDVRATPSSFKKYECADEKLRGKLFVLLQFVSTSIRSLTNPRQKLEARSIGGFETLRNSKAVVILPLVCFPVLI